MTKPHILVIGSSNTDMIVKADRIPLAGETVLGGEFLTAPGGKGANQAVAAARAGGEVVFIARVGNDGFGKQALAGFAKEGIDTEHVITDAVAPSGVALIVVAKNGENSIAVAPGANRKLSREDIENAKALFSRVALVVMQLETPLEAVQAAADLAESAGTPIILNPAPASALPLELLRKLTVLTPNETEAELLTGIKIESFDDAGRAASVFRAMGVQTVAITLGARGAFVATDDRMFTVPAFRVDAVDTTAAGDTFNGALAVALAEGEPIESAVHFANAAAAISVTRLGAQPSVPRREEILRLLATQTAC